MKKTLSRSIITILAVLLILTSVSAQPVFSAGEESSAPEAGTNQVKRAEWLSRLTTLFEMEVEDDNYPDNYFSDLETDSEYYYDVLLAVEFGLVDVEAGDPVYPEAPVTREFAAHTLNYCLGIQLEEGSTYSFSDAQSLTWPDDAQVALNRNWFTLIDGKFSPDLAISDAEAEDMLSDAAVVWKSTDLDENHQDEVEYAAQVIDLSDLAVYLLDDGRLYLVECGQEIKAGDWIGVAINGIPCVFEVSAVEKEGNDLIVTGEEVEHDDAYSALDIQGTLDGNDIQLGEVAEGFTVEVSGGEEEPPAAKKAKKKIGGTYTPKNFFFSGDVPIGGGNSVKVDAEMSNIKIEYKVSLSGESMIKWSGSTDLEATLRVTSAATGFKGITLVPATVPGIGGFDLMLELEAEGKFTVHSTGYLTAGVAYSKATGFRLLNGFKSKSFSVVTEMGVTAGLRARLGLTGSSTPFKGFVYAKAGDKGYVRVANYDSGTPSRCHTFCAYAYAEAGAEISFSLGPIHKSYKKTIVLYNESNSPIRIYHHYEDGKEVASCSRSEDFKYYSRYLSRYWSSGWSGGSGSYGFDDAGEPVVIWTYKLDDDSNATITGYKGNATVLVIPETIDGYKVVAIGDNVFKGNTQIISVEMPDSITEIGAGAFFGCSSLSSVNLPKALVELGHEAFRDDDLITTIEIPKSLDKGGDYFSGDQEGAFNSCSGLKTVKFESGITEISDHLFANCDGLEEITIPDTVTTIEESAFRNCDNLQTVKMPNSVAKVEAYGFADCSSLSSVNLPKALVELGHEAFRDDDLITTIEIPKSLDKGGDYFSGDQEGAFNSCSGLKTVKFESGITEISDHLFANCDGLEEITIPDTVTTIETSAFRNCDNLRTVKMPNSVTKIEESGFADCSSLSGIKLSKSLVELGQGAFRDDDLITTIEIPKSLDTGGFSYSVSDVGAFKSCSGLKTVKFESGITEISNFLFANCDGLEEITIPDTVTTIEGSAFYNCDNLRTVNMPNSVTNIEGMAFADCSILSNIKLSKSLVTLGGRAFLDDDQITAIEIPKSLNDGGSGPTGWYGAFRYCSGLKNVSFEKGTTEISDSLFAYCDGLEEIVIPDTVKTIEHDAFDHCSNLKTVTFGSSVETIDEYAFNGCNSLIEVDLPDSVTSLKQKAFAYCTNLEAVRLPAGLSSLPESVFRQSGLKVFDIPATVTSIGTNALEGCPNLETVNFNNAKTSIGASAFSNCDSLKDVKLGSNITTIGGSAFYDCDALVSITIPDSVTSIGSKIFYTCELLHDVTLGSGITVIPEYAFFECPSLESLTIPYRVTTINGNAFANDTALKEITIPRSATTIADTAFSYPEKVTIYGVTGTYAETYANEKGIKFVNREVNSEKVTLSAAELTMYKGATDNLILSVEPAGFTDTVTWKSSDTGIVTVTDTGLVTAKGVGTATIKVTVGAKSASCKVTVLQPVTSIYLNKSSLSMEALDTFQLNATVNPSDAYNKSVKWSSSDPSIASVSESGLVTAKAKGTAVITVESLDGSNISKTCNITVINTAHICKSASELECFHDYSNNCSDYWLYTEAGAEKLELVFDERTNIEDGFDYLYIYDGSGNEIGKYTGTALAGQTVTISGDTVKIKLVTDDSGTEWGFKAAKAHGSDLRIIEQPQDITGYTGDKVTLKVVAEGEDLTYQWYVRTSATAAWKESKCKTAENSATLTASANGRQLYVVVRNKYGNQVESNVVTFTVLPVLKITGQPQDVTGAVGDKVSLKVVAEGEGLTYQWYVRASADADWKVSKCKTAENTTTLTASANGRQLYVVVTDKYGNTVQSNTVTLTVVPALKITEQPQDVTGAVGEKVTLKVVAEGEDLTYQWYVRSSENAEWKKSSRTTATNATTLTASSDGRQLYVEVKDKYGNSVTSNVVTLHVNASTLKITNQPKDVNGKPGDKVTLKVVAEGEGLTYQWYVRSSENAEWKKSSRTTATNATTLTASSDGRQLYVEVKDKYGNSVTSNVVTLHVSSAELKITGQPQDVTGKVGEKVSLTVTAEGEGLTYQWYVRASEYDNWKKSSCVKATNSTKLNAAADGRQLYVVVTDSNGDSVKSRVVTLHVK